jgi:hypothetical protein
MQGRELFRRQVFGVLLVLSLVAAACGDDDAGGTTTTAGGGTTTTAAEGTTTTAAPAEKPVMVVSGSDTVNLVEPHTFRSNRTTSPTPCTSAHLQERSTGGTSGFAKTTWSGCSHDRADRAAACGRRSTCVRTPG